MEVVSDEKSRHSQVIVAIMKYQIDLDSKLDDIKRRQAQTKDFNLMDAFRIFDYEGKGYVTSIELWQGLTML